MRLRLLVILVALVVIIGFLPYLLHQASQPTVYSMSTLGTVVTWTDGPDIELNAKSLHSLTSEVETMARQATGGEIAPFRITSVGKRRVEVRSVGPRTLPSDLLAQINAYVQKRLPELAKEQAGR